MIVSIIYTDLPCGIIFEGQKNEFVSVIADKLYTLGYFRDRKCEVFMPELKAALNKYRRANSLPESDYCDPISLKMLAGIDTNGDELLLLARLCEAELPCATEVERYDYCRNAISESRSFNLTLHQYINGKRSIGELLNTTPASSDTVKTAVLAYIMESGR
jgi:hypothetical protein